VPSLAAAALAVCAATLFARVRSRVVDAVAHRAFFSGGSGSRLVSGPWATVNGRKRVGFISGQV
jgi:hypothetical protein